METLNISDTGAVRLVELDRPEALNAFNGALMDELAATFIEATRTDTVKALVLTGTGRAFSAGADLMEMGRPQTPRRYTFDDLLEAIIDFPKPFFVAVNGVGAGIGATICGLADFVFMAESARLRCPFSTLGLTAEAASTFTFPRLMGRQRASWFLLASEWMSATECLEAGLAMEVLAPDDLRPRVLQQAAKLAALPLSSLMTTKGLMMAPLKDQMRAAVKSENSALADLAGGAANREALAAFREKREADFTGL